jgi:hypothetical protein
MDAQMQTLNEEKLVRDLQHDAGSVARIALASAGAAVFHIFKYGKRIRNMLVGFVSLDVRNESNTTGIMFKRRIVQTLSLVGKKHVNRINVQEIEWQATVMENYAKNAVNAMLRSLNYPDTLIIFNETMDLLKNVNIKTNSCY